MSKHVLDLIAEARRLGVLVSHDDEGLVFRGPHGPVSIWPDWDSGELYGSAGGLPFPWFYTVAEYLSRGAA